MNFRMIFNSFPWISSMYHDFQSFPIDLLWISYDFGCMLARRAHRDARGGVCRIKAGRGSNRGRRFRTAVRTVSWDMVRNWISTRIAVEIPGLWTKCCHKIKKFICFAKTHIFLESFDPPEARADSWPFLKFSDPDSN